MSTTVWKVCIFCVPPRTSRCIDRHLCCVVNQCFATGWDLLDLCSLCSCLCLFLLYHTSNLAGFGTIVTNSGDQSRVNSHRQYLQLFWLVFAANSSCIYVLVQQRVFPGQLDSDQKYLVGCPIGQVAPAGHGLLQLKLPWLHI